MMFCQRKFLEAEFDTVVGFLRATIKGWLYNAKDPKFAPELVVNGPGRDLGLEIDQQLIQNEIQLEYMQSALTEEKGIFWIDPAEVERSMYPSLRATGRTNLPPATDIFDTRAASGGIQRNKRLIGPSCEAHRITQPEKIKAKEIL